MTDTSQRRTSAPTAHQPSPLLTSPHFGTRLRALREAAGIQLTAFAKRLNYSKSHVSKIETGHRRATPELARRCDVLLNAGGQLRALVPMPAPAPVSEDELLPPRSVDRRQALAWGAGTVSLLGAGAWHASPAAAHPGHQEGSATGPAQGAGSPVEGDLIDGMRIVFEQLRRIGQISGPETVLPALVAQCQTLPALAARHRGGPRAELLVLSARFAEYTGWLAQEAGDTRGALWWTDQAVELSAEAGNPDLAAYAYVRRAVVSLYEHDATQTVALARRAYRVPAPPRVRGLAAGLEAQGHALAGDHRATMHGLDRARELLADGRGQPSGSLSTLGPAYVSDLTETTAGWCLYDLGRPGEAADTLDRAVARIPATALRSRARYGARQALAHATAGNIDRACSVASGLLEPVRHIRSATVAADLRKLLRTLGRFRTSPEVRELLPRLAEALHISRSPVFAGPTL